MLARWWIYYYYCIFYSMLHCVLRMFHSILSFYCSISIFYNLNAEHWIAYEKMSRMFVTHNTQQQSTPNPNQVDFLIIIIAEWTWFLRMIFSLILNPFSFFRHFFKWKRIGRVSFILKFHLNIKKKKRKQKRHGSFLILNITYCFVCFFFLIRPLNEIGSFISCMFSVVAID